MTKKITPNCHACNGTGKSLRNPGVDCPVCNGSGKVTHKVSMIMQLLELRAQANMPLLMPEFFAEKTVAQLEVLIHELTHPSIDHRPAVKPVAIPVLLARLNASLKAQGKPTLKAWKESRDKLIARLAKTEESTDHVTPTKCPPAIADGTTLTRFKTSMHKSKTLEAVQKMSREEERVKQGESPKRVAATPNPERKRAAKATASANSLSPSDLATILGKDARAVRIILRRRENDIPKAWRLNDVRWGFKPEHRDDIVKFLGGK